MLNVCQLKLDGALLIFTMTIGVFISLFLLGGTRFPREQKLGKNIACVAGVERGGG